MNARPPCAGVCGRLADWWHPDDPYAYCDEHFVPHEVKCYQRWVEEKTCGKCGSPIHALGPCPVCDDAPFGRV
jgi:hypothetical protein